MNPKKEFAWSSYTPVVNMALEVLKPNLIVELGVGNFSSPIFIESGAQKTIHIENDKGWFDLVKSKFSSSSKSEIIYHFLGNGIKKDTNLKSLSSDALISITEYYENLKKEIVKTSSPRLLFVDQFASVRTISINILAKEFDFIIYHDAEHPEEYNYQDLDTSLLNNFKHYTLKTPSTWTGFYIRKNFVSTDLEYKMLNYAEVFGKKYNIPRSMFVIKENN